MPFGCRFQVQNYSADFSVLLVAWSCFMATFSSSPSKSWRWELGIIFWSLNFNVTFLILYYVCFWVLNQHHITRRDKMAVTTVLLIFGSVLVLLVMMWWFSVSGQLYRLKSIPVPSGELFNDTTILVLVDYSKWSFNHFAQQSFHVGF